MGPELELTGNETPEEIDALLDQLESDEIDWSDDGADDNETIETEEPKADKTADSVNAEEETGQSGDDETPEGIQAKDGKNIIPYDVLEQQREANRKLQDELNELKSRESDWQSKEKLFDLRNKQLEDLGVNPADLPENFKVTDEQLDSLAEDYPELGPVIRHLFAKVNQVQTPSQPQQQSSNPVADALAENSDLSAWHKENGENWKKALELDDKLLSDPNWSNKPVNERFAEVARLVKEQSGVNAKQKAKEAEDKLSDSLPNSPSEVGQTTTHQRSTREIVESGSEADIQAAFSTMSPAQIEALLSELDT